MSHPVVRTPSPVPAGYPQELCGDFTLTDGRRVHIRPIVSDDRDALRDAILHADTDTLHRRFLAGIAPTSDRQLERLVIVDYQQRLALVAIADQVGVAIARYEPTQQPGFAEAAVAVDPQWRRAGLARELLRRLGRAASERSYHGFRASFLAENDAVTALLRSSGIEYSIETSQGLSEVIIELAEAPPPARPGVGDDGGASRLA